jgi:hypothetical protein
MLKVVHSNFLEGGGVSLHDKDATSSNTTNGKSTSTKMNKKNIVDDDKTYVVERIIKHRNVKGVYSYFVKWKNYPESDNSWVKDKNFYDINIVKKYWKDRSKSETGAKVSKKTSKKN